MSRKKLKNHLKKLKIPSIDLVIVDLYPFEKKLNNKVNFNKLIEYIDIGGPTLARAAAKNYNDVTVISDIDDYSKLIKELKIKIFSVPFKFLTNYGKKYQHDKKIGFTEKSLIKYISSNS